MMRLARRIRLICSLSVLALVSGWVGMSFLIGPDAPSRPASVGTGVVSIPASMASAATPVSLEWPLRNTERDLSELLRDPRAILLENALLDTRLPITHPGIESLRAGAEPGAYIIQTRDGPDGALGALLEQAGVPVVSYIPNNAWLVRTSAAMAGQLATRPEVAAVLPYEPCYKIKRDLLLAWLNQPLSIQSLDLDILLFSGDAESFFSAANSLGVEIAAWEESGIGTVVTARCSSEQLPALARMTEVQAVQLSHSRAPAIDRTRAFAGISPSSTNPDNYLGLSGAGVLIGLADTGVDATHPDLSGRLFFDTLGLQTDASGHGTHVSSIIAGSGAGSMTATNVPGSEMPAVDLQFRGAAPAAALYCMGLSHTNPPSNTYLQTAAAQTNALISNNSWVYEGVSQYDFAAASYDAATRDALPFVSGQQPVLFVFPAGNAGQGSANGTGGLAGSLASPATAKNVLTIGALEQARFITNEVIICTGEEEVECVTNRPWLGMTDSDSQVAGFSSRGNAGIGLEGAFGRFKPDLVAPGTFMVSARSAQFDSMHHYEPSPDGLVLSNLNESIGPLYRFESGTSLAAGSVSGTLALVQEFFRDRLELPLTPALLKALVIHGARLESGDALAVRSETNALGWGALDLPSSLPAALTNAGAPTNSIFFEQQTFLASGEEMTWHFRVLEPGLELPLSATLVWTDPPGNPAAAVKLVNDLDLVLTNLDTGEVFFGNHIPAGGQWSAAWDTNTPAEPDCINNVEKIRLAAPSGTNYSLTVRARQVNVDAGSQRFDKAAQDFALVFSSASSAAADTLALDSAGTEEPPAPPPLALLTNSFNASNLFGTILTQQRFGAHAPEHTGTLVHYMTEPPSALDAGQPGQWRFYVITNDTPFNHAAFVLFDSTGLSPSPATLPAPPADLDLYVSTDPNLLNLDPGAFTYAYKSTGPALEELVVRTDALPVPYYIAVKCESPFGGEAGLAVFFSEEPFSTVREDGGIDLRAVPSPGDIPPTAIPGAGMAFAFPPVQGLSLQRVVVSNLLNHPCMGDLQVMLSHAGESIVLKDFSESEGGGLEAFVFDDSAQGDWSGTVPSATPNGLQHWNGRTSFGPWMLRYNSRAGDGTNEAAVVTVYEQSIGQAASILPGAERLDYFEVPVGATNMSLNFWLPSGEGMVWIEVAPISYTGIGFNQAMLLEASAPVTMNLNAWSDPPLQAGRWRVRLRNQDEAPVWAGWNVLPEFGSGEDGFARIRLGAPAMIQDDATTVYEIAVTNKGEILSMEAGLRLEHPRLGDLAFTLISPGGTRVPLATHRGGSSTNGLGSDIIVTNIFPVDASGGQNVASNTVNVKKTFGIVTISYIFWELPDWMRVYYEGSVVFDSGLVSGAATTNVSYGPGQETTLTVVMNEGDHSDPETAWFYSIFSSYPDYSFLTFTDAPLAPPVKFALDPFDSVPQGQTSLRVRPETPLSRFVGESAEGTWKLEVRDAFAGPAGRDGELLEVELAFALSNTNTRPIVLPPEETLMTRLAPLQTRWVEVATLPWTCWATNCIVDAQAPLNVLFRTAPPDGSGGVMLLTNAQIDCAVLSELTAPPILPGASYYLGLENTNVTFVDATLVVDLSPTVSALVNGMPEFRSNLEAGGTHYYIFNVSALSRRLLFRLSDLTGNAALLVRRGLPLPGEGNALAASDKPGTATETILLKDTDVPLLLAPGPWYVAVKNWSESPISYQIEGRQWMELGEPIWVTNFSVESGLYTLSWTSVPGIAYNVFSSTNLATGNWINVSGRIVADDAETTHFGPAGMDTEFFRISENLE